MKALEAEPFGGGDEGWIRSPEWGSCGETDGLIKREQQTWTGTTCSLSPGDSLCHSLTESGALPDSSAMFLFLSRQTYETNKAPLFINYPVSDILLQQQKDH